MTAERVTVVATIAWEILMSQKPLPSKSRREGEATLHVAAWLQHSDDSTELHSTTPIFHAVASVGEARIGELIGRLANATTTVPTPRYSAEQSVASGTGSRLTDDRDSLATLEATMMSSMLKPEIADSMQCGNARSIPHSQLGAVEETSSASLTAPGNGRPPHFTAGIVGPPDMNPFGLSMDFDMTVLWIAAWYRRGEAERRELLNQLRELDALRDAFGSEAMVVDWLSAMQRELDRVQGSKAPTPAGMDLQQLTELIAEWNRSGGVLRGRDNNGDLLDPLDGRNDLMKDLAVVLLEDLGRKKNRFVSESAVSPAWDLLNLLRHWSVVGHENQDWTHRYIPREPMHVIQRCIEEDGG